MKLTRMGLLPLALAAVAGSAAGKQLPTVEVRADDAISIYISCKNPVTPSTAEVARLLGVTSEDLANRLRFKVAKAAAQACTAGVPHILLERSNNGRDVRWIAGN
jgi:hypothetical protein